jgi:hypothetical protein
MSFEGVQDVTEAGNMEFGSAYKKYYQAVASGFDEPLEGAAGYSDGLSE